MKDVFKPVGQLNTTPRASLLKLNQPLRKTNHGQKNISYIASIIWNNLPNSLNATDSLNAYKHRAKENFFHRTKNEANNVYRYFLIFCFSIHSYFSFTFIVIYIIIIIITIIITFVNGNSTRNSTSSSIIIIFIIVISSSSFNKISVLLTISTYIFELFVCFLFFYINIPHQCFFKGPNINKVLQLFCVIALIAPYGEIFTTVLNFNEFIFVYIVNIKLNL